MTVFKSKIDLLIFIPLFIILSIPAVLTAEEKTWSGFVIVISVIIFFLHLLRSTEYIIVNTTLVVRCSFLINTKIDIKSINKITETNTILSAPAASLDRIEILYNQYDAVIISPKDKSKFIEALKKINPAITIVLKTDSNKSSIDS
jgi:hypothetical protein